MVLVAGALIVLFFSSVLYVFCLWLFDRLLFVVIVLIAVADLDFGVC